MSQDVYICYDVNDQEVASRICNVLEKNELSCWIKSRDVGANDIIEASDNAIENSHVMILIYSKYSKDSNIVNTEADLAFGSDVPVLIYKIDDTEFGGGFPFFIDDNRVIDAHENVESKFDELISILSVLVKQQKDKKRSLSYIIKKHKKPIVIAIALIVVVIAGIFAYMNFVQHAEDENTVPLNPGDVKINVTDFHVDDVRKKGYSWNYSYFVGGIISPEPVGKYVVSCDFYDKTGNLVNTTETEISDIQRVNDGYLLGSDVSGTKDITRVEVNLLDAKNRVIAQGEAEL
ncbi:MAG: toll/interleukin-1 receptor domain-containing protein [Methanobrevibacter sp.]|uniref:toll/interleukin-1 receptor domain-containing protein n=1 Tax=uncultured Methanobrevibacter sp. TaxID=253161 RepID=UPI0025E43CD5|nr:toll/interleukin-1 receptor domain-containing protein [uncultured Methanobrevibacter sp.]MEE1129953.1 toll/interleukin-1 receptor domain-containing protein [Methanobrevibacter sp.]